MRNKTKQLLEENNQAEKALSQEGQKILTDLVVYLRGSRASVWEQEQVRRDITRCCWMRKNGAKRPRA